MKPSIIAAGATAARLSAQQAQLSDQVQTGALRRPLIQAATDQTLRVANAQINNWSRKTIAGQGATATTVAVTDYGVCDVPTGQNVAVVVGYDTAQVQDGFQIAIDGAPQPGDDTRSVDTGTQSGNSMIVGRLGENRPLPYLSALRDGPGFKLVAQYGEDNFTDPATGITHQGRGPGGADRIVRKPKGAATITVDGGLLYLNPDGTQTTDVTKADDKATLSVIGAGRGEQVVQGRGISFKNSPNHTDVIPFVGTNGDLIDPTTNTDYSGPYGYPQQDPASDPTHVTYLASINPVYATYLGQISGQTVPDSTAIDVEAYPDLVTINYSTDGHLQAIALVGGGGGGGSGGGGACTLTLASPSTAGLSLSSHDISLTVPWDTAVFDTDGMFDVSTPGQVTIQHDGTYIVAVDSRWSFTNFSAPTASLPSTWSWRLDIDQTRSGTLITAFEKTDNETITDATENYAGFNRINGAVVFDALVGDVITTDLAIDVGSGTWTGNWQFDGGGGSSFLSWISVAGMGGGASTTPNAARATNGAITAQANSSAFPWTTTDYDNGTPTTFLSGGTPTRFTMPAPGYARACCTARIRVEGTTGDDEFLSLDLNQNGSTIASDVWEGTPSATNTSAHQPMRINELIGPLLAGDFIEFSVEHQINGGPHTWSGAGSAYVETV